jgi:hypothetical protein
MDVCLRLSVLCCPVSVEALRRADPPAKESYQMSLYVDREAKGPRRTVSAFLKKLATLRNNLVTECLSD